MTLVYYSAWPTGEKRMCKGLLPGQQCFRKGGFIKKTAGNEKKGSVPLYGAEQQALIFFKTRIYL